MHRKHPPIWRIINLRPRRPGARVALWLCACVLLLQGVAAVGIVLKGAVAVISTITEAQIPPASSKLYDLQTQPPYTVALDAGHGGMDSGAEALVDEVDVCEKTVDALFALLQSDTNYQPVRTRQTGEDLSTTERAEAAINSRASLLLSVHANCDPDTRQAHGFECFPRPPGRLYSAQSMQFAQCLSGSMAAAGHRLRGDNGVRFVYYSGKSKKMVSITDTKVRSQKSFGMVEKPACPAVLVEQCFLTNYNDVENWATDAGCRRAARVYYEAICAYFGTQPLPAV